MESDTIESYSINIDIPEMKLRIIDTPGLNDTRGSDKDNIANIIHEVRRIDYVNCVCLVFSGSDCRMTSSLRELITEIGKILPQNVLNNLIVLLTKSTDRGDTTFKVSSLKNEFGLTITPEHTFYINNPYSRWVNDPNKVPSAVKSEFDAAFQMLKGMFSVIRRFKQVRTHKFGELNEVVDNIKLNAAKLLKEQENIKKALDLTEKLPHQSKRGEKYF